MCFRLNEGCTGNCPHPLHYQNHDEDGFFSERTDAVLLCRLPTGDYTPFIQQDCPNPWMMRDIDRTMDFEDLPVYCDECADLDDRLRAGFDGPELSYDEPPLQDSAHSSIAVAAEEMLPDLTGQLQELELEPAGGSEENSSSEGGLVMDSGLVRMSSPQRQAEFGRRFDAMARGRDPGLSLSGELEEVEYPLGPTLQRDPAHDTIIGRWQGDRQERFYTNDDRLCLHYNHGSLEQAYELMERLVDTRGEYDPNFARDYRNQYGYNDEFCGQYECDQSTLAHTEAMSSTHGVANEVDEWPEGHQQFLVDKFEDRGGEGQFDLSEYGVPERPPQQVYSELGPYVDPRETD